MRSTRRPSGVRTIKRSIFLCVGLTVCATNVAAVESVDVLAGLIWIGNPPYEPASDDGRPTGAPNPILNTFGLALPISIGGPFYFVPELWLFGTQYGIVPGFEKTVLVEREFADAIWFLVTLLEARLWVDFPLSNSLSLGFDAGAAFLGRIPLVPWGDGWDQLSTMAGYFYGQARFLYPEAGLTIEYRPQELSRMEIQLRGKAYFPLFHAWDGEGSPFHDQFMVSFSVGLRLFRSSDDTVEDRAGQEGE